MSKKMEKGSENAIFLDGREYTASDLYKLIVEHLDTTTFYRQIANDLTNFQKKEQANFDRWAEEQEESHLATMDNLVEIVRTASTNSKEEILNLLAQLNDLVDSDTVGKLILQINDKVNREYVDTTAVSLSIPASGWVGDSAPYTQTIAVDGLTDGRQVEVHPAYGDDIDANLAMRQACGFLSYAKREGQNVTITCLEDKPAVDIAVIVEAYV